MYEKKEQMELGDAEIRSLAVLVALVTGDGARTVALREHMKTTGTEEQMVAVKERIASLRLNDEVQWFDFVSAIEAVIGEALYTEGK